MNILVLAAIGLAVVLPTVGFVLRRSLPYQKRPALHEASFGALVFQIIRWPYRWPDSEVERIRRLMFANQTLGEISLSWNVSEPVATVARLARNGNFQRADEVASRLRAPDDPATVLLRAYVKQQLGQPDVACEVLRPLASRQDVEARLRLWAFAGLRELGEQPGPEVADEMLGLVVETEVDGGVDSLAMYPDGQVRLVLHNGHITFYDSSDARLRDLVAAVGAPAQAVYLDVPLAEPPSEKPRGDDFRFTFLTPAGSRSVTVDRRSFGQGSPYTELFLATGALFKGLAALT